MEEDIFFIYPHFLGGFFKHFYLQVTVKYIIHGDPVIVYIYMYVYTVYYVCIYIHVYICKYSKKFNILSKGTTPKMKPTNSFLW